jgi:hypothetical protein
MIQLNHNMDTIVTRLFRARRRLSEPEIAAVTAAVAAQHFFNPITGELGADAAPWIRSVRL